MKYFAVVGMSNKTKLFLLLSFAVILFVCGVKIVSAVGTANLAIQESAISCGRDGDCAATDDNSNTQVNPGEKIQHTVSFENSGDLDTSDGNIIGTIGAGNCYVVGTIESSKPVDTTIIYSNNNGSSYAYMPSADSQGKDCAVTNWKMTFTHGISNPYWYTGEWGSFAGTKTSLDQSNSRLSLVSQTEGTTVSTVTLTNPSSFALPLIVDVDGDGKKDIVFVGYGTPSAIYRNTSVNGGIPSFASRYDLVGNISSYETGLFEDIDGDGKKDLIFNSEDGNSKAYRNLSTPGTILFSDGVLLADVRGGSQPLFVDVDGDGKKDVIIPGSQGSTKIFRNTSAPGTVSFASGFTIAGIDACGSYGTLAKYDDIDGDGVGDLIIGDCGTHSGVYRNISTPGTIQFGTKVDLSGPSASVESLVVDVDGDGKKDVVLAGYNSAATAFRNTSTAGNISFSSGVAIATTAMSFAPMFEDIDGDGKNDLVLGGWCLQCPGSVVVRNTSTSGTVSFATPISLGISENSRSLFEDVDGDGKKDIIMATRNQSSIFRNTSTSGTITFAPRLQFSNADVSAASPLLVDVNLDGKKDLALGGMGATSYIYLNTSTAGNLSFNMTPLFHSTNSSDMVRKVVEIDANSDNVPEILFVDNSGNHVIVVPFTISSGYSLPGSYTKVINISDLTSYHNFKVNQSVPANTGISYSLYQADCTTALAQYQNMDLSSGIVDISGIPSATTSICLKANFSSTNTAVTPILNSWQITYTRAVSPTFTYSTIVPTNASLSTSLSNSVAISSSSSDSNQTNNEATVTFQIPQANLKIQKRTNRNKVLGGDIIIYTLTACNIGQIPARGTIKDTIPSEVYLESTVPDAQINGRELIWQSNFTAGECKEFLVNTKVKGLPYVHDVTVRNNTQSVLTGTLYQEILSDDINLDTVVITPSKTSNNNNIECARDGRNIICSNTVQLTSIFDPTKVYDIPAVWGGAGDNYIYKINQTNWIEDTGHELVFTDTPSDVTGGGTGLATDPTTGIMYAVVNLRNDSGRTPGILVTVNPETGSLTKINRFDGVRINSLAFTPDGTLYGTAGLGDSETQGLFLIDKSTASLSKYMSLSTSNSGRAIVYNPEDNYLYYAYGYSKNIDVIDLSTKSIIRNFNTSWTSSQPIGALVYVGNDTFYGDAWGRFLTIKASTGETTVVGFLNHTSKGLAIPQQKVANIVGSLQPGESFTVHIAAESTAVVAKQTVITNTATITPEAYDIDRTDNTVTATNEVNDYSELVLTAQQPVVVMKGNNITYTYMVTNNGTIGADNLGLTMTIPTGTTYISANTGNTDLLCTTVATTITCANESTPYSLPAGEQISITITLATNTSTPNILVSDVTVTTITAQSLGDQNTFRTTALLTVAPAIPVTPKSKNISYSSTPLSDQLNNQVPQEETDTTNPPAKEIAITVTDNTGKALVAVTVNIGDLSYKTDSSGKIYVKTMPSNSANVSIEINGKKINGVVLGNKIVAELVAPQVQKSNSGIYVSTILAIIIAGVTGYVLVTKNSTRV